MKKKSLWLVLLAALLFSSTAWAGYVAKVGDTLSGIAKQNGVTLASIKSANPQIKNVNHILVGQEINLPENGVRVRQSVPAKENAMAKKTPKKWLPGSAPTKATPYYAIQVLPSFQKLTIEQQRIIFQKVIYEDYQLGEIQDGTRVYEMTYTDKSGKTRIIRDRVADLHKTGPLKAEVYSDPAVPIVFVRVLYCNNMSYMGIEVAKQEIKKPVEKEVPPTESPINLVIPSIAKAEARKPPVDEWDWYVGGGNYHSRIEGSDNHGGYAWMKFRYRPIQIEPDKNGLGIKRIGLGGFGFLAGGDGIAARYYDYSWKEAVVGVTAKIEAQHSDYDLDLGIGKLWNKGSWMSQEDRDQIDDILLASAHGNFYRAVQNAKLFRKFELNAEYRLPIHTEMKKGTKVDNQVVEGTYTQWIYAIEVGEDGSLVVSPGFNLGIGYEWGNAEDKAFAKVGPALEVASYNHVIAGASVLNYKVQNEGQWAPIGGYVSIDGVYNAYKAAHITAVSADDLKSGQGSKVLANPADYLD